MTFVTESSRAKIHHFLRQMAADPTIESTLRYLDEALRTCNTPAILSQIYQRRRQLMEQGGSFIDEVDSLARKLLSDQSE